MTLANFNSNFNFQLRALQQAAECCGIVPDLPPEPPPPVTDCYWYVQVNDPYCTGFSPFPQEWELNGLPYSNVWSNLMIAPPYGTNGGGTNFADPLVGCGSFNYSSYYMWTMVPSTTLSLPALNGFDSFGNPITYFMNGPICSTKCYEGSFSSLFGSSIVYGINTGELNASDYSIFVDLTSPSASSDFASQLRIYYPLPPLNVSVRVNAPNDYTIRIDGLYSLGAVVNVLLDDGTIGVLNEVPC